MAGRIKIAVDTGGTFTDICLLNEDTGELSVTKVSSTPDNPALAVIAGLLKITNMCAAQPSWVDLVLHGTTVATNALLERMGARAALITTAGFRDVLYIGRQNRPSLYDFRILKPPPLIPRRHTYEVSERVLHTGEARTPLDEEQVRVIARNLRSKGFTSVAVCLLHSYANPYHESRIKEIFEEEHPGAFMTLSSEILPEFREYERACAAAINALVRPKIDYYLGNLEGGLRENGISGNLLIMHSGGGMITSSRARSESARTVLSGPAGGVLAGMHLGRKTGLKNIITLDMGGTSTDVCLIRDGEPGYTSEGEIGGYPLRLPMIDMHTIGAGGGSIAWLDSGGALRVGPRSAGADPGPACYGLGGTEPTVTDANLLLGRINPRSALGDKKELDTGLAMRSIEEKIARPLGLKAEAAAEGILKVVNANMVRAIRLVSVRRGHDPREYALMCFGGAGPLHGASLARDLDMAKVVIPRYPGVTSALGMLWADVRLDFSRTFLAPVNSVTLERLCGQYAVMEREGTARLKDEGFDENRITLVRQADLRYAGQSYEITLPLPGGPLSENELEQIKRSFHAAHEREYGWRREEAEVELVNLRLAALGSLPKAGEPPASIRSGEPEPYGFRKVYFEGFINTPVYRREDLAPGFSIRGPAVVEQDDSTTLLYPGMAGKCDRYGNLIIE